MSLLLQGSAPDGQVRIFALADGKRSARATWSKLCNTG